MDGQTLLIILLGVLFALPIVVVVTVIMVIPGALFGAGWKGLGFVNGKAATVLERVESGVNKTERVADTAGNKAAGGMIWLYSRAAWVRGFTAAAWRLWGPRRP